MFPVSKSFAYLESTFFIIYDAIRTSLYRKNLNAFIRQEGTKLGARLIRCIFMKKGPILIYFDLILHFAPHIHFAPYLAIAPLHVASIK